MPVLQYFSPTSKSYIYNGFTKKRTNVRNALRVCSVFEDDFHDTTNEVDKSDQKNICNGKEHTYRRRFFFTEILVVLCCEPRFAFGSAIQQDGTKVEHSVHNVRYKGKEWSVILPDTYQRVSTLGGIQINNKSSERTLKSESPILARFSSENKDVDVTVSLKSTNALKLSLLQANSIEELGTIDSLPRLFLPASAIVLKSISGKSENMRTFYSWEFIYENQRVLLSVIFILFDLFNILFNILLHFRLVFTLESYLC